MPLRRNQLCPIHRSLACCGREPIPKEKRSRQMGICRSDDPKHPRGYREIRSKAELRKLIDRKIAAQNGSCAHYNGQFPDYTHAYREGDGQNPPISKHRTMTPKQTMPISIPSRRI